MKSFNNHKKQIVTVLINDQTKQFFITFNNFDTKKIGLYGPLTKYKYLKQRINQITNGTSTIEKSANMLRYFDHGLFWAFENSNLDDWYEDRFPKEMSLATSRIIAMRLAEKYEEQGYCNARVTRYKSPQKKVSGNKYGWGKWNPNKTHPQFMLMMDKIMKNMNKKIPETILNQTWLACVGRDATIKNKFDLWDFLEVRGVFEKKK